MKKLFLIPLMAMLCTVMAWGETRSAGTFAELQSALTAAQAGDVIQLTADIAYPKNAEGLINITKSITLDGQGHKISGYGNRGGQPNVIAIQPSTMADVVLKNLEIYSTEYRPLETRGNISSLTLDNVTLTSTGGSSNPQGLTIGGTQATVANVIINNSNFEVPFSNGYALLTWNPVNLSITESTIKGWAAVYFKGDSYGSTLTANDCKFASKNVHSTPTNAFALFPLETTNVEVNINNCSMDAEAVGSMSQDVFSISPWTPADKRGGYVRINISGDNTYFFTSDNFVDASSYYWVRKNDQWALTNFTINATVTISGGTYSVDPRLIEFWTSGTLNADSTDLDITTAFATIPSGYEVKEIKTYQDGDSTTLYRVRKAITTSYNINQDVEGEGDGLNENTEFIISGETTEQTLTVDSVVAHYVEVSDTATLTIPSGKSLEITNGLDVTNGAQVVIEAGSTVKIGEGGVTAESVESIVIEADDNGSASFILDPAVIVNTTPNLTVKMKAKNIGWIKIPGDDEKHYFWHRFALPIQEASTWVKVPNKSTYVFGWNYSTNDWEQYGALTQMVPFQGYTLSADYENRGDIEYTFTGQLAGNTNNALNFQRNGFNFFGNSYTGYIDILALVDQIMGDNKIDGTVWMWYQDNQSYVAIPLQALRDNPSTFDPWMREVAPMQTFILKQNGSENASAELNYASAVWGNPRYGNKNTSAQTAPQRIQNDETTRMRIIVKADNGKSDFVMLTEDGRFSDAFEKGYDGEKYMNENALNMYATVNDVDYTAVATDNLAGKALTLNTVESVNYTMSFAKVNGEAYAIRDLMTNIITPITEGNTYTFAAQPNTTIEGRFVIVPIQNMPTDVETVENNTTVKGIYTVTGQYVGENFDILPAGMYIVNGVKIVK